MKLWSLNYNVVMRNDFPQLMYKELYIPVEDQVKLTHELFNIFLLTHRDNREKILKLKHRMNELPYKELHNMILPDPNYEFSTEYLVDMLNIFEVNPLRLD